MIRRHIKVVQDWRNLEKGIFNEKYERNYYIFGIRIFKHNFDIQHTGQLGESSGVGFTSKKNTVNFLQPSS